MLRFDETKITQLLKETIKVICRSADNCSEIAVQGLLGITLDRKEIFLVQIDDVIDKALERTGNPFHANGNNGSTDRNSTQSLSNQTGEQFQPKPDLNLTTGSVEGRTVNNSTAPENHITQQTWDNSSVADSAHHSLLQLPTQRSEKTRAKDSISISCLSDVHGRGECSSATTPVVMAAPTATKPLVSKRGRGRSRGQRGRGKGRGGRGRGQCGRGRGKLAVTSSCQNKGSPWCVSDGLSGVPLQDNIRMRTRSGFISEVHRTVIRSFQETVDSDSQRLENLEAGNESKTVGSVQSAQSKTLKTLKQPGFKRKLKPHGVITSKKSKRSDCSADFGADTGVVTIQPQVSSSDQSLYRCSVCKRAFPKPTDLVDHYILEHYNNLFTGHAASPALEAVQDETPVTCLYPTCGRTFPKQLGMLQHYGRIHGRSPSRGRGRGRLRGACSGTVRRGLRLSTLSNLDTKPPEMSVIGQIIPSTSYAVEPGSLANTQRHSLPDAVARLEISDAGRDGGGLLSSSMIIKQEIDSRVGVDSME